MKIVFTTIVIAMLLFSTAGNMVNPMTREDNGINTVEIFSSLLEKSPPCVQVYYYTKYYCKIYNVPEWFAFRILRQETNYKGPAHFNYNPSQVSKANALGPFQVLLSTGRDMYDGYYTLTRDRLLNDVRLNVKLGVKYIAWLSNQFDDWYIVAGRYNSGKPRSDWPAETVRYAKAVMS